MRIAFMSTCLGKNLIAAMVVAIIPIQAVAGFLKETEEDVRGNIISLASSIGANEKLGARDILFSIKIAAAYYYVGPCNGNSKYLNDNDGIESIEAMSLADPRTPMGRSELGMIGVIASRNLGRPSDQLCSAVLNIYNASEYEIRKEYSKESDIESNDERN